MHIIVVPEGVSNHHLHAPQTAFWCKYWPPTPHRVQPRAANCVFLFIFKRSWSKFIESKLSFTSRNKHENAAGERNIIRSAIRIIHPSRLVIKNSALKSFSGAESNGKDVKTEQIIYSRAARFSSLCRRARSLSRLSLWYMSGEEQLEKGSLPAFSCRRHNYPERLVFVAAAETLHLFCEKMWCMFFVKEPSVNTLLLL